MRSMCHGMSASSRWDSSRWDWLCAPWWLMAVWRTPSSVISPGVWPAEQVGGKVGALGDNVKVVRDKSKVSITSEDAMSKRYLKCVSCALFRLTFIGP